MRKSNDISTPQGYFEDLQKRLQTIPTRKVQPTVIQRVSPWIAYAASLALMVAVGNYVFSRAAAQGEDSDWDYISYLTRSLDPDGQIDLMEEYTLSEEDIRSYLIADNISVELIHNLSNEEDY